MGTSNWQHISDCIQIIRDINPKSILDVGVGFGRWGILSREFLEIWEGKINSENWKVKIDGIEIFPQSIKSYHEYFYDNIIIDDAYNYVNKQCSKYDLIILGDVLEHFEKERAVGLLKSCIANANFVLLNIPIGKYWKQNIKYENKYEEHLSFWNNRELRKFGSNLHKKYRDQIFRKYSVFVFYKERKIKKRYSLYQRIAALLNQYPKQKRLIRRYLSW